MRGRKRRTWTAVITALAVVTLALVPALAAAVNHFITAEAGVAEELNKPEVEIPVYQVKKNRNKELGSAENPFIILEIVPFEAYAEIGYLVGGCEPIDFEKAKYVGSLTEANNILSSVNSVIGGTAFSVEEMKKHVDYYRNSNAVPGEDYPAGYLESSAVENCYGYFRRVSDGSGKFNITGDIEQMNLKVSYCGTGGDYDFVIEAVKSETAAGAKKDYPELTEEYLNQFNESRVVPGENSVAVSLNLSNWYNNAAALYAYCDGAYGYFEQASGQDANYQVNGAIGNKDLSITYCGGDGNFRFVKKDSEPDKPYEGFDGVEEKEFEQNGTGVKVKISSLSPEPWSRIYAYYNGKYGYLTQVYYGNSELKYSGRLTFGGWNCDNGLYNFVEDAEAQAYFDGSKSRQSVELSCSLGVINTVLTYTKNDIARTDTIRISYANSTQEQIYASIHSYAALEYHYSNKNYFLKHCLMVPDDKLADYKIQVITVTPETLEANQDLIAAADYINITDAPHVTNMPKLWSRYYRESLFSPSAEDLLEAEQYESSNTKRSFLEHDLSWEVTVKLLCKISMDDGSIPCAPMSIAVTCYQGLLGAGEPYSKAIPKVRKYSDGCGSNYSGTGTINNLAKLYMMLVVFEAEDDEQECGYFYKNYIETGLVREKTVVLNGKAVTTGCFDSFIQEYGDSADVETAALYWNPYTFLKLEEHDVSEVENHTHETGNDPAKLYQESNMIDINGGSVNSSVRNNVFTYNSDCSMTQHVVDESFQYEKGYYHEEPFTIIEFCEKDALKPVDIIYYLLNQKSSSLSLSINGSDKNQVWANVDYDSEVPQTAIAGKIIMKDGQLYGRVFFNVSLTSNKEIANSKVEITIYRDPSYDNPETAEREDIFTIGEAYQEDGTLGRIQLYKDCYWDVPLEKISTLNTEDLKFSMKVYYRYKGYGDKGDAASYDMSKSLHEYQEDASGKVVKDNRRVLTFVRRALFDLE